MSRVRIRPDEMAGLPRVCVCCGEPAKRLRQQEFHISGAMAMSAAILVSAALLNTLVWTRKDVTLSLPVSEYHRTYAVAWVGRASSLPSGSDRTGWKPVPPRQQSRTA